MTNIKAFRALHLTLVVSLLAITSVACSMRELLGAPTSEPMPDGNAGIAGRIWHDLCANPPAGIPLPDSYPPGCVFDSMTDGLVANSLLDPNERGIENLELVINQGICPGEPLRSTTSAPDGMFLFAGLAPGTYCVTIDPSVPNNNGVLSSGRWTYPAIDDPTGPMAVNVVLGEGEVRADVYFAWDYALEPVYEAPPVITPTIDLTPSLTPTATSTPLPSATLEPEGSPTPSPSPTFSASDPRASLGVPTWEDDFENDGDFFLYSDSHVRFEMKDGQMELEAFNPDFYSGWSLGWRKDTNMVLEATFSVSTCADRDMVGLVFRAPDNGKGYLYGITCDGRYSLRYWDGEQMSWVQNLTSHSALKVGSDQTQRVAVWTNGNQIGLYANGELLKELFDTTYTGEGPFGVFISSAVTPNFQARVSEWLYWNSP